MNPQQVLVEELENMLEVASRFYKFKVDPTIDLVNDVDNGHDVWGKTAEYDPQSHVIRIYSTGRGIKDQLRSCAHELVHHDQNLRGDLTGYQDEVGEGYYSTNPRMRKLELEAYKRGNDFFRRYEDMVKKKRKNQWDGTNLKSNGHEGESLYSGMYQGDSGPAGLNESETFEDHALELLSEHNQAVFDKLIEDL